MKLQGAAAERFTGKPDAGIWACLIFGDDPGVVAEAGRALIQTWSRTDPDTEVITFDEDTVRKDKTGFYDTLEARSLLGNLRILRVRTSGDKIASILLDPVGDVEQGATPPETRLIIEAGALKTRSKLRTVFESGTACASLHLFADEAADTETRVRAALQTDGVTISDEALALFVGDLPGHRGLANAEIGKLSLFARGLGRALTADDIRAIATTDADQAVSQTIDAMLDGQVAVVADSLDRLALAGTSPITLLRGLERDVLRLLAAHGLKGSGGDIGMKLRPPVFRPHWPAFRSRMDRWSTRHLTRILERVYDTEALAKSAAAIALPSVRTLFVELAQAAARQKR